MEVQDEDPAGRPEFGRDDQRERDVRPGLIQGDFGALFGSKPLDVDVIADRDPVLLSAGLDYCVHVKVPFESAANRNGGASGHDRE